MIAASKMTLFLAVAVAPVWAQTPVVEQDEIPVFHATAVSRSIKSVNFHYRQGATDMALTGTALAPKAKGTVRADSKTGATKLDLRAEHLPPPWTINDAMLTYVVWAITPDGRPEPVGELAVGNGDDAHLVASSELQAFGLIVTAEPYFAVSQPSDIVVMEGTVTPQTAGTIQTVDAKFDLLPRNSYVDFLPPAFRAQTKIHGKAPVDLLQARHALAIAESFGAARYAEDIVKRAHVDLGNAEAFYASNSNQKRVEGLARGVVQLSEDARLVAVRRRQADELEKERQTAAVRLQDAQSDKDRELRKRELAEADTRAAEARAAEAGLIANEARRRSEIAAQEAAREAQTRVLAQAEAEASRQKAATAQQNAATAQENAAAAQQAQRAAEAASEQTRLQSESAVREAQESLKQVEADKAAALVARQAAEQDRAEATRLLADARQRQTELSLQAEQANARAADAEKSRDNTREQLRQQLNVVLVTRQTARGLVVNMSGVLFDTGKSKLSAGAREKLAKVAGILQTHPSLKLQVEGHTDSTGSPTANQKLSAERAMSVGDFLIAQGVKSDSVSTSGKGQDEPVASNSTSAGRQQNRRVEIVVSGGDI